MIILPFHTLTSTITVHITNSLIPQTRGSGVFESVRNIFVRDLCRVGAEVKRLRVTGGGMNPLTVVFIYVPRCRGRAIAVCSYVRCAKPGRPWRATLYEHYGPGCRLEVFPDSRGEACPLRYPVCTRVAHGRPKGFECDPFRIDLLGPLGGALPKRSQLRVHLRAASERFLHRQ